MSEVYLMPRDNLHVRYVDTEVIILDRETDKIHHLNPNASYIWSKFDGNTTVDDIIQTLINDFDEDPTEATKVVTELVEQFTKLNLLVTGTDTHDLQE